MSNALPESPNPTPTDDGAENAPSSSDPNATQLARYTIHVPVRGTDGQEIPHVLAAVRQAMTDTGFPGRLVLRKTQADWREFETEEMDLVMADAPDTPENRQAILQIADQVKELAEQDAIYVTVQQLDTYLV